MHKPSTFAERLKTALDYRQMTKAELSRLAGISKSSLTRYAKGDWEAKQDSVYAMAQALDVNEAWLMGYDAPMERAYSQIVAAITEEAKSGRPAAEDEMFRTYGSEHSTNEFRPCEGSKKFGVLYYGVKDNRKTAMDMSGAIATLDSLDGEQLETAKFIIASYFKSSQTSQDIVLTELRPIMEELKHKELAYAEASCET